MRRAIVVATGTVIGLIALLDYKSSGAVGPSKVIVGGGLPVSAGSTTTATTAPSPTSPSSAAPGSSAGNATTTTSPTTVPPTTVPPTTAPPTTARGPASYTGAEVEYVYGNIDVRITVADDRITAISTPVQTADDPRSTQINAQAIPILTKEALAAQGVHFDVVSGATFTSDAFAKSLESALGQAGK